MQVAEHMTYRATGRMVLRRIGKDQLLVPVSGEIARTNAVFPVNQTGAFIWEHLTKGETPGSTAERLAASFDVPVGQAGDDVTAFVKRLLAERLLEPVTS